MKRVKTIFDNITIADIQQAINKASQGHRKDKRVARMIEERDKVAGALLQSVKDGTYKGFVEYRSTTKRSSNGKVRDISQPSLTTRVLQHLVLIIMEPLYARKDPHVALNCKAGCGNSSKDNSKSVMKRMKNIFYDQRQLRYGVYADQRKSYEHLTECVVRKGLSNLTEDTKMIDFIIDVCMVNGSAPIGTPTGPFLHHVAMLEFDIWLKKMCRYCVRYADDIFAAVETKQEASELLWRIKQRWWYMLGMEAKNTSRIISLDKPFDFCGYVYHRYTNDNHCKGWVMLRKATAKRAKRCNTNRSWASYFGLMRYADCYGLMKTIERKMKLRELTENIRIERRLDAKNIEVRDIVERPFDIIDYDFRHDAKGEVNWVKCLVSFVDTEGRKAAREFHGNYQGIIKYLQEAEKMYGKEFLLPIEDCMIVNECGYIFKDSTNQILYFD